MADEASAYAASGVNYEPLDRFKRLCQVAARDTTAGLARHGMSEPEGIRGESAYLIETPDAYLAHVEEGLGTKNLVADEMARRTGMRSYRAIGLDTVATIVNDMITVGALPLSVAMHAAVGNASWFDVPGQAEDLAAGWAEGCRLAGAVWGGGETPVLPGLVEPEAIVLAGSAIGQIRPKHLRIRGDVREGDRIILLASSGVHANGVTLCRALARRLPDGYLTPLGDGRTYGEALLDPTPIYVPFLRACQERGIALHYAVNVTGHGWRKLMRPSEPFVYRVDVPPPLLPVFSFLVEAGGLSLREAYATFNMGAGFAVYVSEVEAPACLAAARESGFDATDAGVVSKQGDRKAVEIPSIDVSYEGSSLQLRG